MMAWTDSVNVDIWLCHTTVDFQLTLLILDVSRSAVQSSARATVKEGKIGIGRFSKGSRVISSEPSSRGVTRKPSHSGKIRSQMADLSMWQLVSSCRSVTGLRLGQALGCAWGH